MASTVDEPEPFGTTSIPIGNRPLSVTFDDAKMGESFFGANNGITIAQQPQTQAFATYDATKNEGLDPLITLNGSLIDVNPHFVVYALKNGLIRVLHRQSAMRALLRGHSNQVITDISFFHDGDTVATVGHDPKTQKSTLIVWRVYEKPPEIGSERLLEITNLGYGGAPDLTISRLFWHPFNPNQFWMTHSTASSKQVATLVETTRIQTKLVVFKDPKEKNPQQHAACQWHGPYSVMENALQLKDQDGPSSDGQLVDLCWSGKNLNNVMSVHKNGSIILWDLKERDTGAGLGDADDDYSDDGDGSDSSIVPKKLYYLKDVGAEHSRCIFLPHEQSVGLYADKSIESVTTCFATAAAVNSKVTIWSSFAKRRIPGNETGAFLPVNPVKLQELNLPTNNPSSFVIDVCFGPANLSQQPPSSFLLLGSRDTGRLYALHLRSEWSKNDGSDNNNQRAPLCSGIDYLVPFSLKHPVYSWSVICGPTQDVHEDDDPATSGSGFDIKAFAYQSKAVQCLTVTNNMSLPPKNSSSNGTGDIYTVENLQGPCVGPPSAPPSAVVTASGSGGSNEPVAYDEDEYDVDDEDDDGDEAVAATSAPSEVAAPTAASASAGTGGLFPGAPNPFANWLGAIAGSTNGAPGGGSSEGNVSDGLPTPPAPSDLPMPPGITPSTTPPPPGILAPPPGMVAPPPPTPASTAPATAAETTEGFLNPLELLAKSMGNTNLTDGTTSSNKDKSNNNNRRNNKSKSPKRNNNKSPRRSRSPKPKKGSNKGNTSTKNKIPFPDGKVTILKRASDNTPPPPIPADPSVLSDPALLAAAGIPVPLPVVSDPAIVAALQQPIAPAIDPAMLEEQVRKAVEEAVSATVIPAVQKSVQDSFATLARPLQKSMNELGRKGVSVDSDDLRKALDVETPLNAAFASNLKNVLVPSLQSITGQVLQQVEASMPKPPPPPPKDDSKQLLGVLVKQFQAMATKMDALSAEVQGLRKEVSEQAAAQLKAVADATAQQRKASTAGGSSAQGNNNRNSNTENNDIQTRNQIDALLSKGKYEEAFTKAVATTTPQMAVYCCARSDVRVVLSDHTKPPVLSSPILICLMQQLSAALAGTQSAQEMQIELGWLQEITLTMNPTDPSIVQHVPKVLKQLVANVNSRLLMEGNGHFRRPLQMLLQSLMGMQLAMGK